MSDQTQSTDKKSPEYVSLEKRFGIESHDDSAESATENVTEAVAETHASEKDESYQNILSKVQHTNDDSDDDAVMQDASVLHQQTDRESQITHLIDLAMTKGVAHSVKVAQKAEDYYVLDQLHDQLLSDDLHDALVAKGLIEQ